MNNKDPLTEQIEKIAHLIGVYKACSSDPQTLDKEHLILLSIKALLDCKDTPTWLKSPTGYMLYINPAYSNKYNIDPEKYAGAKDEDVWGKELSQVFREYDKQAMDAGKTIFAEEEVEGNIIKVKKWPVYIEGKLIGVAGEVL